MFLCTLNRRLASNRLKDNEFSEDCFIVLIKLKNYFFDSTIVVSFCRVKYVPCTLFIQGKAWLLFLVQVLMDHFAKLTPPTPCVIGTSLPCNPVFFHCFLA